MADHLRKQIRDALQTYLSANLATVTAVMTNRVTKIEEDLLPCLLIFTNEESASYLTNEGVFNRSLQVTLEAYAETEQTVDTLDAIAVEVESQVSSALPAWIKLCSLISTSVELSGDPAIPSGLLRLDYEVEYQCLAAAPDTPL